MHAMESEIMLDGQHFLIFIPFKEEYSRHIEELEEEAHNRSRSILINNRILYEELMIRDSTGRKHYIDVILQRVPNGITLKDAVHRYRANDLHIYIQNMRKRLDAIGFSHNNLTPSNIIICENGVACPLRYWYSKWEVYSNNDISHLINFINSHNVYDIDSKREPLLCPSNAIDDTPTEHEGITRVKKCGRYGFIDNDGTRIKPYIYTWASDFCEGRAIVALNGKMGVINSSGKKVIAASYKNIEFNVDEGVFIATNDKYHHILNYEGTIIDKVPSVKSDGNKVTDDDTLHK